MKNFIVFMVVCLFWVPVQAATLITYSFNGTINAIETFNAVNADATFGSYIGEAANITVSVRSDAVAEPSPNGTAVRYTLESGSYAFHTSGGTFDGKIYINDSPTFDDFSVTDQTEPISSYGVPAGYGIHIPHLRLSDPTGNAITDLASLQLFQISDFSELSMELNIDEFISNGWLDLTVAMNDVTITQSEISVVPLPTAFWIYGSGLALLVLLGRGKLKKESPNFS